MVLYYNRFIILFIKKIQKINLKILQYSTVQLQMLPTSTNYITTAFMLALEYPGLEIKVLYYCTLYSTVQESAQKRNHL